MVSSGNLINPVRFSLQEVAKTRVRPSRTHILQLSLCHRRNEAVQIKSNQIRESSVHRTCQQRGASPTEQVCECTFNPIAQSRYDSSLRSHSTRSEEGADMRKAMPNGQRDLVQSLLRIPLPETKNRLISSVALRRPAESLLSPAKNARISSTNNSMKI